jgi:hypothetical protein
MGSWMRIWRRGEVDPPLVLIVEKLAMCQGFVPNHMLFVGIVYSPEHVIEDCPDLLKKWEEKKTHCNMVHAEPHKIRRRMRRLMSG